MLFVRAYGFEETIAGAGPGRYGNSNGKGNTDMAEKENQFLDMGDLADLMSQLDSIEEPEEQPMTEEELASKRRYEEIIKKHKEA